MDLIDQGFCLLEGLGILVKPLAHHHGVDRNHTGNEQTNVILCSFNIIIPCLFVVLGTHHIVNDVGTLHSGDNDPVADLTVADSKRCE